MSNIRIIIFFIFALNTFIKSSTTDCMNTVNPDTKNVCYDMLTDDEKEMIRTFFLK